MKQFNLQEYIAHPEQKIVTRDGKKVRIICTDAKSVYPVIGLVDNGICGERLISCQKNGRESNDICESANDLFFVPEKHEGWIIIDKYPDGVRETNGIIYHTKSDIPDKPPIGIQRIVTIKIEWEE